MQPLHLRLRELRGRSSRMTVRARSLECMVLAVSSRHAGEAAPMNLNNMAAYRRMPSDKTSWHADVHGGFHKAPPVDGKLQGGRISLL